MRKILDRVYIVCQGVRQAEACQLRIVRKKVKRNLSAINDAQFLQRSNWWQSSVSVGDDSTEGETEGIVATSGSTAQPARMNAIINQRNNYFTHPAHPLLSALTCIIFF